MWYYVKYSYNAGSAACGICQAGLATTGEHHCTILLIKLIKQKHKNCKGAEHGLKYKQLFQYQKYHSKRHYFAKD
jgi:hypothetical protein